MKNPKNGKIGWINEVGRLRGAWSFLVMITPYMEATRAFASAATANAIDWANPTDLRDASFPVIVCPSNPSPRYRNDFGNNTSALSSYKAIAATHWESARYISPAAASSVMPLYPVPRPAAAAVVAIHPDGAIYPDSRTRLRDLGGGISRTALVTECIEPICSRWIWGPDTLVYVLNPTPKVTFKNQVPGTTTAGTYWYPNGFNGSFGDDAGAETVKTCIACNYGKTPDRGTYQSAFESDWTANRPYVANLYGPSSGHSGVVNHLFGDGSVRSISRNMDAAALMFISTRAAHDPTPDAVFR